MDVKTLTVKELKLIAVDQLLVNASDDFKQLIETAQRKLDAMDNDTHVHYLEKMYDDYVIYRAQEREGGSRYYKQTYQVLDSGDVDFTGVPAEVRKQVDYVAMTSGVTRNKFSNNKSGGKRMSTEKKEPPCCEDLVNELITNERTRFTEDDKETLLAMEEEFLKKLIPEKEKKPTVNEPTTDKDDDGGQQDTPQINAEEAARVLKESISKPEDFIKLLPDEIKDQFTAGLKLHREQRDKMVKVILANTEKGTWAEEKLKGMDFDTLTSVYESVKAPADYTLTGDGPYVTDEEPPMIPVEFEQKSEGGSK